MRLSKTFAFVHRWVVRSSTCPSPSDRLRAPLRDKFKSPTDLSFDKERLYNRVCGADRNLGQNDLAIILCDSY